MARHLPGCASFGFVIRLPMNFQGAAYPRFQARVIFGCGSAGKGSHQAIRTFPRGCTNGPLQKRGKGGHAPARAAMGF